MSTRVPSIAGEAAASTWSPLPAAGWQLQRKCACGAAAGTEERCAACENQPLQRQLEVGPSDAPAERDADRVADAVMRASVGSGPVAGPAAQVLSRSASARASGAQTAQAAPRAVHAVLASSGQPLDAGARAFFEPRFGHDFSRVRIHHDSAAAASARSVAARAYTVGPHVVFDSGHYAPGSLAGRRLLAHELAHVVQQQGAVLRRDALPAAPIPETDDVLLQRAPAIVGLDKAGPNADLSGEHESEQLKRIGECMAGKGADPNECEPGTPLSWADFKGTPTPGSKFGAATSSGIRDKAVPSQECAGQVLAGGPTGPTRIFQGVFNSAKSWVKSDVLNAANPAKNGSATMVAACERDFDKATAQGKTGITWNLRADPSCPAGAPVSGAKATSKASCKTTIAADFTAAKVADSPRLLKHEQFHFNLSCAMARKANRLLWSGTKFEVLDRVIRPLLQTTQAEYDSDAETHHGCNAGAQATWESAIADGLPKVKLP